MLTAKSVKRLLLGCISPLLVVSASMERYSLEAELLSSRASDRRCGELSSFHRRLTARPRNNRVLCPPQKKNGRKGCAPLRPFAVTQREDPSTLHHLRPGDAAEGEHVRNGVAVRADCLADAARDLAPNIEPRNCLTEPDESLRSRFETTIECVLKRFSKRPATPVSWRPFACPAYFSRS